MKLALIGQSIEHSLSPQIYKSIISQDIVYDLIDVPASASLPSLHELSLRYNGVNITSPYKRHYFSSVIVDEPDVMELGAINTISFSKKGWFGTNTDLLAVLITLQRFQEEFPKLHLIILGSGVMGTLTSIAARKLNMSFMVLNRGTGLTNTLNLRPFHVAGSQNIIINACSRDFIFQGELNETSIFWDFNYNLLPHQNTLPSKVKTYLDGQEMLLIQAQAAAKFWSQNNY
jgi:shikimate dehydrogenase